MRPESKYDNAGSIHQVWQRFSPLERVEWCKHSLDPNARQFPHLIECAISDETLLWEDHLVRLVVEAATYGNLALDELERLNEPGS